MEWVDYYFNICKTVALKSKDSSTKVGAVIVGKNKSILSAGYNGFPRGVDDDIKKRHDRPLKYCFTAHAEANAIYQAARNGICLNGTSIYIFGLPPCNTCTQAIIQSGISFVCFTLPEYNVSQRWGDEWRVSRLMLDESGVEWQSIAY
jgi:dCMP deaminase